MISPNSKFDNEEVSGCATRKSREIHFPDLDGWRFVAFLSVFFYHGFHTELVSVKESSSYKFIKGLTINGNLGVDFFFVLSGFLIIYLLISERRASGSIDIKKFYIRRVLRIFPLYYLCVGFGFILFPLFKWVLGGEPSESADWRYYIVFLSNFDIIRNQVLPDAGSLGVLWSIAVEEQFYLTVPLILIALPTRFYPWVFSSVIAFSVFFRIYNATDEYILAMHTFSFAGNLAIGGLMAYWSISTDWLRKYFQDLSRLTIALVYLLIVSIYFFRAEIFSNPTLSAFSTIIAAALFGCLILEQTYSKNSLFKMRNIKFFSRMGKYTYGLYCLHLIAAVMVLQITGQLGLNSTLWQIVLIETPLMLLLSIGMAYFSYHFFEKHFLKLKERFSSPRPAA